jgi:hypothetical protein
MKFFHTLHRGPCDGNRHFERLQLTVYQANDPSYLKDELFTLNWQCDREFDHWYGFRLELSSRGGSEVLDQLKQAHALVRRILEAKANLDRPEQVIPVLKMERRVYDSRRSLYLPLDQIAPADHLRWMATDAEGYCIASALAPNQDEAQKALIAEFAQLITTRGGRYAEKLDKWMTNGKPIRRDTMASAPDVRPLEELLTPLKAPAPPATDPAQLAA